MSKCTFSLPSFLKNYWSTSPQTFRTCVLLLLPFLTPGLKTNIQNSDSNKQQKHNKFKSNWKPLFRMELFVKPLTSKTTTFNAFSQTHQYSGHRCISPMQERCVGACTFSATPEPEVGMPGLGRGKAGA